MSTPSATTGSRRTTAWTWPTSPTCRTPSLTCTTRAGRHQTPTMGLDADVHCFCRAARTPGGRGALPVTPDGAKPCERRHGVGAYTLTFYWIEQLDPLVQQHYGQPSLTALKAQRDAAEAAKAAAARQKEEEKRQATQARYRTLRLLARAAAVHVTTIAPAVPSRLSD